VDAGEGAGLALGRDVAGAGGACAAGAGVDAILERDGLGVDADGVASARDDVGRVVRQRRLSATERERIVLQGTDRMNTRIDRHLGFVVDVVHDRVILRKSHHHES